MDDDLVRRLDARRRYLRDVRGIWDDGRLSNRKRLTRINRRTRSYQRELHYIAHHSGSCVVTVVTAWVRLKGWM